MIIGNKQGQEVLQNFFQYIEKNKEIFFPFLLLDGAEHIGKTTSVELFLKKLLGKHFHTDYKAMYDLREPLGKKHAMKVSVSAKDSSFDIDGKVYENMGTRELIQRFSLAPMGKYKIIFLENIERMTVGAANAFLKTLEEPLPGRLIVATTTNKDRLLDTIISRAFIVSFQIPLISEVQKYLEKRYTDVSEEERNFAAYFSLGRLGLAKLLLDNEESVLEKAKFFHRLLELYRGKREAHIVEKYNIRKMFHELGLLEEVTDAVMFSLSGNGYIDRVGQILHFRKLFHSNIGTDNIIFGMSL